jgi:hypothetical protein
MTLLASYLNLKIIRRLIVLVGFLEAAVLLADIGTRLATGQYLTSSLPPIPTFWPNQWMMLFINRLVDVMQNPWVFALFFTAAGIWIVITVLFIFNPSRLWLVLIVAALLNFWYSPIGIWLGVIEIILLASFKVLQDKS